MMIDDQQELNDIKKTLLGSIKKDLDYFLKQDSVLFFALTTDKGLIIEKYSKKEIDARLIGGIISKILNISNWSISKLDENSNLDSIEICYKTGILIIKPINKKFVVFLLLKRMVDKNNIYLFLNSLSFQIISSTGDYFEVPKEFIQIDNSIAKLKELVQSIEIPKLSEIKNLLKYMNV